MRRDIGSTFTRANFVTELCERDAPQLARMRSLDGPFVHRPRSRGACVLLDTNPGPARVGRGRQVAFTNGPGRSQGVAFLDQGSTVAKATLIPSEADVVLFAAWAVEFLYAGALPNLSAYLDADLAIGRDARCDFG